jgi:membrane-associated protease RseP (regulator of RpoE activity)
LRQGAALTVRSVSLVLLLLATGCDAAHHPNSPVANSGLRLGDVVDSVNRKPVDDIDSFRSALKQSKSLILLHIKRKFGSLYLVIK